MSPLPCSRLADWAGGVLRGPETLIATRVWTDSRSVQPGDLFVALRGEHFDGHDFLPAVARAGAVGAVVDPSRVPGGLPADFCRVEVADSLGAYQKLAARWRQELLALKVVAITGSNGKTSTKDFTAAVLRQRFRTRATLGNLNNHVGLPRTLLATEPTDEAAVWEIGMNHFGEIAPLARIAAPQVAIITNVGMAHLEFLRTRAGIAWEKGRLLDAVDPTGLVILPASDDFTASVAARSPARVVFTGGSAGEIRAENIVPTGSGNQFDVVDSDGRRACVRLAVPGRHMVSNALLAVAAGRHFGLSLDECAAGLCEATLSGGRLERRSVGGWHFLDDTYNANPDSVVAALATLAETPGNGHRFAILGQMGELGDQSAAGHYRIGAAAAAAGLAGLCVVGQGAAEIARGASKNGLDPMIADGIPEALAWLRKCVRQTDLTLVKGSRSAGLERLFRLIDPRPTE